MPIAVLRNAAVAVLLALCALVAACSQGAVGGAEPHTLELMPQQPSLACGTSTQMVAIAHYPGARLRGVTDDVAWEIADSAIAAIAADGRVTALLPGTTEILARHATGRIEAAVRLVVTDARLVAIDVTPRIQAIANGTSHAFVATGTFTDATTQDLSAQVDWTVAGGIASITGGGLATGTAVGVGVVTATDPQTGIVGTADLTVTAATLMGIDVTPTLPSIAKGTTQQFAATGTFTDATTQDLTGSVDWTTSTGTVATIDSGGLATGAGTGTCTITAMDPATSIGGTATLTVTAAELVSIVVTPAAPSIPEGTTQQFAATGTYTDNSTQDLTAMVTWSSSATSVATIANGSGSEGLATGQGAGTATITATHTGASIAGSTTLDVTAATLVSIAVAPVSPWVLTGTTRQYTATGTYSDNSTRDVTASVTWSVTNGTVAGISNAGGSEGVATALAAGTTSVTATDPGTSVAGSASIVAIADPVLRGAASDGQPTGVTSLSFATPTCGLGDVLFAVVTVRPYTATITPPSGWSLVRRVDNSNSADHSLAIYRRAVTASEPTSHVFTLSTSTGSAGGLLAIAGLDATTPVDVSAGQNTASSLSHTAPSVTTSAAGEFLVTAYGMSSATSFTPPAGMSEAFDARSMTSEAATGITACACTELLGGAGATGTRTAVANAQADVGNTATLALRRAP